MPLVEIEIIGTSRIANSKLTRQLADALGEIMGSPPAGTWVRLKTLPYGQYAENGTNRPLGRKAVFVTITHRKLPPRVQLRRQSADISRIVGRLCKRPAAHVHVICEAAGAGRIAFGGKLID